MCLAVYLGSFCPLPLVAWDQEHPGFHVRAIDEVFEQDRTVRQRLETPFVYCAGSTEGCGCGFQFRQDPDWEENRGKYAPEEAGLRAFRDYLGAALRSETAIRVFAFWEGDSNG